MKPKNRPCASQKEISALITKGTAGINNYSTFGFSLMSMLSGQKIEINLFLIIKDLMEEFTSICNNNFNRHNYYWKKHYYKR